ncbi:AAA family ATPase [Vibrio sp. Makdt]|uniref:UvrD-helicase domain-containing protein n=1 Tax=Vibrio sp. Makdt TaxID=2998828 RepID=UPI0022CD956B|nr:UvrD-helicase domain-containing protein [Vibrio sp. Makdt]MDA0152294.1 AAA family ATPase [Vibrio sp. Makdt]
MNPTVEQHDIKMAGILRKNLIVRSFAGTGKTWTTKLLIESICSADTPVLYITFAVSNVDEALEKMGHIDGLKVTNIHKLAFDAVGSRYKDKLGDMNLRRYKELLGSHSFDLPKSVQKSIANYIVSDDKDLSMKHVPTHKTYKYKQVAIRRDLVELSFKMARKLWSRMIDVNDRLVKIPHDAYLKLYCQRPETIQEWLSYSSVIVDEGQDQAKIVVSLEKRFAAAKGHLVKVGDDHQNLYRFRECSNGLTAFDSNDDFEKHQLTQSFRFGQRIADAAKCALKLKGASEDIKGTASIDSHIRPSGYKVDGQRVVLHRTAAGVLRTAISLYKRQIPMVVIGGVAKYFTTELGWFEKLKQGQTTGLPWTFINTYPNWKAVERIEKQTKDPDLTRVIRVLNLAESLKIGNLEKTIAHIDEANRQVTAPIAILSTVHKFKGLESPNVVLSDDFIEFNKLQQLQGSQLEDEVNIIYVAITRAIYNLVANDMLVELLTRGGLRKLITGEISPYA